MYVIISGCRQYDNYDEAKDFIDSIISRHFSRERLTVISGHCRGSDLLGERYAEENALECILFPAEWALYGRKAGPIRNEKMASLADALICFWDGTSRGTRSMISCAERKGIPVFVKRIDR